MRIGTKSLLFGAHQVFIHPVFIFIAWCKLYGFPTHPALWLCFVVHDWGYLSARAMDSLGGEQHPELGANIVRYIFGDLWGDFCLYHSRRYAKLNGKEISQLCVADKLATVLVPSWIYVPMVCLTGELAEYMKPDAALESEEYLRIIEGVTNPFEWFEALKFYMKGVVLKTRSCALSVEQLRWQRLIDHYIAIWGESNRDSITDALLHFERSTIKSPALRDTFVAACCSKEHI